jgi:nitrite reductase/ring-hydroxylating ferredoxin subunit
MPFVKVAVKKELEASKMMSVEANGKAILLTSLGDTYYAIDNTCTHMKCMLSDGELTGENVRCPCHGSMFNVKTGSVVKGPAKKPEPTYQVKVDGDHITVNV